MTVRNHTASPAISSTNGVNKPPFDSCLRTEAQRSGTLGFKKDVLSSSSTCFNTETRHVTAHKGPPQQGIQTHLVHQVTHYFSQSVRARTNKGGREFHVKLRKCTALVLLKSAGWQRSPMNITFDSQDIPGCHDRSQF